MNNCALQAAHARWIGLKTLTLRECSVILKFWRGTLAPPVLTTFLYFTVFGAILGKRIGPVQGFDYVRFMAPGLIVLWVVPYAYGHTASGLVGARIFGFIEEILVSPMPDWLIMAAYMIAGTVRGVLVGMAATCVTLLFVEIHIHSVLVSIGALLLSSLLSSLGGFITALFARSFEQVSTIQSFILVPLTYLGGVFSPLAILPGWAQRLSLANPVFHMVNAFRYGFLGIEDVPAGLTFSLLGSAGVVLLLTALVLMACGRGIAGE